MIGLIDSYIDSTTEFNGKWYIAKPLPDTRLISKIKAAFGVYTGKYTAVYFWSDKVKIEGV